MIDEQHKFGVRQRAALRQGKESPHYLVMTATPIPRTITMTLFGDLDVTTLGDMPPGRQPVSTYVVEPDAQERNGGILCAKNSAPADRPTSWRRWSTNQKTSRPEALPRPSSG